MHGTALYERRRVRPERVDEFLEGQRAFQQRLLADFDEEQVRGNQRLVWTWDSLSLGLLLGWAPFELEEVGITVADGTLDPWPFREPSISVRCEGRRLSGRFESEEAMRQALNSAAWVTIECELTQTSSG
jgi:hypothetical protein